MRPARRCAPDSDRAAGLRRRRSRDSDGFNWGYDPLHYTAPEGSYATDPDGAAAHRSSSARWSQALQRRRACGWCMDVVYNHTAAAGQDAKSVLDRIVPGYYHRLSTDGAVATSTCCANTATEHAMMEQADGRLGASPGPSEYKVDGFRFDLMGHHPQGEHAGRRGPRSTR